MGPRGEYCQAQSQLQVKLSLKTELALISVNPWCSARLAKLGQISSSHGGDWGVPYFLGVNSAGWNLDSVLSLRIRFNNPLR